MDKFIDCIVDNDLKALVIEGIPTQDILIATWDKIYTEFAQLSSDGTYNEVFEISKEIEYLRSKIYLVDGIIYHLQLEYDQRLVDILNSYLLRCTLQPEDMEEVLYNKLNAVIGRAKKWLIRLKQLHLQLSNLRKENIETLKMDRNFFDDELDAISQFNGFLVKPSELTVSRYCRTKNRIRIMNDRKQFEKTKTKR